MNNKHESMIGIMKLYDLRREPKMREAREWFDAFYAGSFEDIAAVFAGKDDVYFRMVLTYWDMAASFVNHGAIDEQMFNDINVEHIAAFAKVAPFISELREMAKTPTLLTNLEKLVLQIPNANETMTEFRERAKAKQTARQQAATA